jgi:hypothetical protein
MLEQQLNARINLHHLKAIRIKTKYETLYLQKLISIGPITIQIETRSLFLRLYVGARAAADATG